MWERVGVPTEAYKDKKIKEISIVVESGWAPFVQIKSVELLTVEKSV